MRRYKKKDNTKRNQIIIGIFLVVLMVTSLVGFVINFAGGSQSGLQYGKYSFELSSDQSYIFTEVDDIEYRFYNLPQDVEFLRIDPDAINDLNAAKVVYFTFDPNAADSISRMELMRFDLDNFYLGKGVFMASGIHTPDQTGLYGSLGNIDCFNATEFTPVIKLINGSSNSFSYENNCLIIEGNGDDFIRSRDRLLFGLTGIIE